MPAISGLGGSDAKESWGCLPDSLAMRVVLFLPKVCVNAMFSVCICIMYISLVCIRKYTHEQYLTEETESLVPASWDREMGKF